MTHAGLADGEVTNAALKAIVASAAALVVRFPECFWFWRPDVRLQSADDVRLVVKNLRRYGNREAWTAAQQLDQCLSANSRKLS